MSSKALRLETGRPNQTLTVNDQDALNVDLHLKIVDNEVICLTDRFTAEEIIERGRSYTTFRAVDNQTGQKVAIKKRARVFPTGQAEELLSAEQVSDPKLLVIPKRVFREMRVLCHLHHPNILNVRGFVPPISYREFGDVLLVLDYVETNLKDLLDADKKLVSGSGKYLMYQILSAINYIHSAGITHGDVRPDRIAINSSCDIKVGDIATTYVQDDRDAEHYSSRFWYRAPEVLRSNNDPSSVTNKVDIWAAGCVMAEILTGTPLFKSVENFEEALDSTNRIQSLSQQITDPVALDLINKLLEASPESRPSAQQALQHEWLSELFTPDSQVLCEEKYDWNYEQSRNDVIVIKRGAFDTILDFEQVSRKPTTPITRLSSPIQRAENIKRMQLRLNSPAVEVSKEELMFRLQESVERAQNGQEDPASSQVNTSQEGFASPRERKKSLFDRMKEIFGKNNAKK